MPTLFQVFHEDTTVPCKAQIEQSCFAMSLPMIGSNGLLVGLHPALLILAAGVAPWEVLLAGPCQDQASFYVK